MPSQFDTRQVQRSFSRAAAGYDQAAALQQEVASRLAESLEFLEDPALERPTPGLVVDVGSGTGRSSTALQARWPRARVLSVDIAPGMLAQVRRQSGWPNPFVRRPQPLCADARALPLADRSVDVLFSNLCLQWIDDLPGVLAGFRRVLKPGGMLLVSTFGHDTLVELREAFAAADEAPHVSPFVQIGQLGDAMIEAGFKDPVLDRDVFRAGQPDMASLMRHLRELGATNAMTGRRRTLTGRGRFERACAAYESLRSGDGTLPVTWEVIYAQAWGPPPGAPIRVGGVDEVQVPVTGIQVRRR